MRSDDDWPAIVIGAGPAGLAVASLLKRAGIATLVLESEEGIAASWRARYDGLRLNTVSWISGLPHRRMPRQIGRWPTRDDYVGYLEDYARDERLSIELKTHVRHLTRDRGSWRVSTSRGPLTARAVVVATGYDRIPFTPAWPGRGTFSGELTHAADYQNSEPYQGRDVLVVACGNSAADIATELSCSEGGARRVWMATRTPPNIFPREILGLPLTPSTLLLERAPAPIFDAIGRVIQRCLYGDLTRHGLPLAPDGVQSTMLGRGVSPVTDNGFVSALKRGRIRIVAAVQELRGDEVVLQDGKRLRPDAMIVATGYRRGLEPLVGHLGVLDDRGHPRVHGGDEHPSAPGVFFIAYVPKLSGQLHDIRSQARAIAKRVAGQQAMPSTIRTIIRERVGVGACD